MRDLNHPGQAGVADKGVNPAVEHMDFLEPDRFIASLDQVFQRSPEGGKGCGLVIKIVLAQTGLKDEIGVVTRGHGRGSLGGCCGCGRRGRGGNWRRNGRLTKRRHHIPVANVVLENTVNHLDQFPGANNLLWRCTLLRRPSTPPGSG